MTGFALKLIALLSMFTDHSSFVLYMCGHLSIAAYYLLRGIGRLAFPIYCFLLVEGFVHSSDRRKYALRLMLLALLSQIPFTLTFCVDNYYSPVPGAAALSLPRLIYIIPALLALGLCIIKKRPAFDFIILPLFILLPGVRLSHGSYVLLDGHMNVFYTLAMGLMLISLAAAEEKRSLNLGENLMLIPLIASFIIIISPNSDYGLLGLMLIFAFFLFRSQKFIKPVLISLWAFVQYGIEGPSAVFFIFALLSALPVFLYNGRRGPALKYFFYAFYPLHLLLLRLIPFCT